ncbi:MAG: reprolysin-like metallopeptidase [Saprospiraceae bacterium]
MKIYFLCLYLLFCWSQKVFTQETKFLWSLDGQKSSVEKNWDIQPQQFLQTTFDFATFYASLRSQTAELSTISIPNPEGNFNEFSLEAISNFEPNLQQKYPGYYSFYGQNTSNTEEKISISVSPLGMHIMVLAKDGKTFFVDPPTLHEKNNYLIYYKQQLTKKPSKKWFCPSIENLDLEKEMTPEQKSNQDGTRASDCRMRTYRLALACTGEYGIFHGGTIEKVLAAYNTAITRVNGVYLKEIGIFFKIIDNVDKIIFFNPSTDPYTNTDASAMLNQNQTTVDQIIGRPNYDIGHVFSTSEGGIASLGSVCGNRRAQGVTGLPSPVGDHFFIDYVCHEMGHQFRANHTQNNSCQRNSSTAVEPGSGSTIMGYAGICSPDVQNNSNDYFHTISLSEISSFILNNPNCGVIENFGNTRPSLTVPKNSYTIPVSTPFFLKANAVDDDGDQMTFTWEQMNNQTASMPPKTNNSVGPMFRSISPISDPTRYFPDLRNKYGQWEVLPSVERTMNFRCTVRDNHLMGACTNEVNVAVNTVPDIGPLSVTNPNSPTIVWQVGTNVDVTWAVANTDQSPIFCTDVNIYLSIDGGTSYPILLAEKVSNNGLARIQVPNHPSNLARLMVVSHENIFFDVSNFSFTITNSFDIEFQRKNYEVCDHSISIPLNLTSLQPNFQHQITFELIESPNQFVVTFPDTLRTLPILDSIKIDVMDGLVKGIYPVVFQILDPPYAITDTLFLVHRGGETSIVKLISPENGKTYGIGEFTTFMEWEQDIVENYTLQISKSPQFVDSVTMTFLVHNNTYEFSSNPILPNEGLFFWRVKVNAECVEFPWSNTSIFGRDGRQTYNKPLLRNNLLVVENNALKNVSRSHLDIDYEEEIPFIYKMVETGTYGSLIKIVGGLPQILMVGDTFSTQTIRDGNLYYQHGNNAAISDKISFLIENDVAWFYPVTLDISILHPNNLNCFIEIQNDIYCFGEQSTVTLYAEGGSLPYMYQLVGDTIFTPLLSNTIELPSGVYQIIVVDAALDSVLSNVLDITSPPKLINETQLVGYNLEVQSIGGAGFTREYALNGSTFTNESIFPITENQVYITTVKDIHQCEALDTIEVSIIELKLDSIFYDTELSCADDSTLVHWFVSGGVPPYSISVNGISYTMDSTYLKSGSYTLSITDSGGKLLSEDILIQAPEPIVIILEIDHSDVYWETSGGQPPYLFSFDGLHYFTEEFALDVGNGVYQLYVKDSVDCLKIFTFNVSVLQTVGLQLEHPLCYGELGAIYITPENGVPPFTFGIDKNNLDSLAMISGLSAGMYTLYVSDALGDSIEQTFEIFQPDSLKIEFLVRSDSLTILVSGGTPPYQYSVDNGLTFFDFYEFYGVPKGIYNIIVRDNYDCYKEKDVEISYSSTGNLIKDKLVRLFPNPTSDLLILYAEDLLWDDYNLKILNTQGQIQNFKLVKNDEHSLQLDVNSLTPGLYLIHISKDRINIQLKLIKI